MLSRTAENLYWLGRYIERTEATARLIEMGMRMAMLPGSQTRDEWRSVAQACGIADALGGDRPTERLVIERLILDAETPSSIRSCLERARNNGRAVRTALTQEMWESLNDGWRTLSALDAEGVRRDLPARLDWVKNRAARFRGSAASSMLRNDGYDFLYIGYLIERADMTLRLLDVKYWVLLPETEVVGGGRDHYQWTSVLWATAAVRAYHHVYRGDYAPWKIADFLILNRAFPRSVAYCYANLGTYLDGLAAKYGERHACQQTAAEMIARLEATEMGALFADGLHEFIQDGLARTRRLSDEIYRAYHF